MVGVSGILNILRVALSKKARLREPTMSDRNISGADLVAPGLLRNLYPLLPLLQRHAPNYVQCTFTNKLKQLNKDIMFVLRVESSGSPVRGDHSHAQQTSSRKPHLLLA